MKKHFLYFLALLSACFLWMQSLQAQTTKTVGVTGAHYSTLKSAFDAINAGTLNGEIILQVIANTSEPASAVLYASGIGSSNYTSVKIYPTGSYSISTSGNWSAIDLNGADNVTFDGRLNQSGAPNSLTITGTSTENGAAVIRFVHSAENNVIKYCKITGSSPSSSMGIISFAASNTGNGNDNNIVEYCDLTRSNENRPYNAILSAGTSGRENSGNIIRNNNIYNTFQTAVSSNGININSASIGFTISGNSIYETTSFAATVSNTSYNAIRISTTAEHTISGNYIGGSAPLCSGTWSFTAPHAVYFCGIYAYAGTGTATTISNNTIANMNYSSKEDNPWDGIFLHTGNFDVVGNTIGAPTGTESIVLTAPVPVATTSLAGTAPNGISNTIIVLHGGSGYSTAPLITFTNPPAGGTIPTATANVSGGAVTSITVTSQGSGYTTAPSVIFDGQSNNYSTSHGMIQNSPGTVNITGNSIGSIKTVGSDYYSHGFESVYVRGVAAITTLTNNLIGSLTEANSINTSSAAASSLIKQDVYGIYSSGINTTIISGNTIANLVNGYAGIISSSRTRGIATIAGSNTIQNNTVRDLYTPSKQSSGASTASVIGISQTSNTAGTTQIVTGNTIYNLSNTNPTAKTYVSGIYYSGLETGTNTITGNFIHSLSISSSDLLSVINGIEMNNGSVTCANNIVSLGVTVSGGYKINGIWEESTSATYTKYIYFNTVYLGGSVTGTTSSTSALWSQTNYATRNYRNNILSNTRSGGSGGKHYALYLAQTNNVTTGLTINYNDYYSPAGMLGKIGNTEYASLDAAWKAASGGDANSVSINPGFTIAGGTSAINYYPSATLPGEAINGISMDYFGITRNSPPKMGAIETNANVWQGDISTDFATLGNWTTGQVPVSGADISFATSPANDCVLDNHRTLGNITNGSNKNLVVNGKTLTINSGLVFTGSGRINTSATSSTVKFNGSSAQMIQSAAFLSNSVSGLTVDNSSGATLNGDLTVSAVLTLASGVLTVGANTLTISGSSPTSAGGTVNASHAAAELVFANASAITLPATFFTGAVNNLTLSGAGGVTAGSDITVNGVLNLAAANPVSGTKGSLEMVTAYGTYPGRTGSDPDYYTDYNSLSSYTLYMGSSSTTTGTGDVTGIVKRDYAISANTPYTFGNQFTTISLTSGTSMPTSLSVTITLGKTAVGPNNTDIIRDAIKRTYEIIPSSNSSGSYVTANFHYSDNELTSSISPYHVNSELKMTTMDYDIGPGGYPNSDEHGRANYDYVNNYIGLSSVPVTYFIYNASTHNWRTIFTLRDYGEDYYTWNGSGSSNWATAANWTLSEGGSGIPNNLSHVIIPDAGTTPNDPVLPSGSTTINTLSIENGGILSMGSNTLVIENHFSGGWEDQNPSGNDPGTSTVIFSRPNTTISGNARFYNVQIAAIDAAVDTIADITNQTGSKMKIGGSITRTGLGTGKWHADVFGAAVEYNGGSQTVVHPDGSPDYHTLILSGSGTKTLVSGYTMHGDFIITGTALAIASGPNITAGTMSIGPQAKYTAGNYIHTNGGFIIYSDATGTGSFISDRAYSGTVERYIPNNNNWHFLSSPVASQPIWPQFAPTPPDSLDFGPSPWSWDFYYWNPNANETNQLYWVNLRKEDGTYNSRTIDLTGSEAGFGTAVPNFTIGRGYLTAYNTGWNTATSSPETHSFTGTLNAGTVNIPILKGANQWNLVGNPYSSAIDWKETSGWTRDKLVGNETIDGYDYWIASTSGNYGVFNSMDADGTLGTSKDIAPMQAFFVLASATGSLSVTKATQLHSSQSWLKETKAINNLLKIRLGTTANSYYDEMIVAVNPVYSNGGSFKFYSMYSEAPELYSIKKGINYSIDRLPVVDENSLVTIGIKPGVSATYTIDVTGIDNFYCAKSVLLEDLKTGTTQELKNNHSYTFSANPGDNAERFHLHFGGPFGIENPVSQPGFTIFSSGNSVVISNISGKNQNGEVYIFNILGEKTVQNKITGQTTRINLQVPGCYIVTLVTTDQTISKKVIIR